MGKLNLDNGPWPLTMGIGQWTMENIKLAMDNEQLAWEDNGQLTMHNTQWIYEIRHMKINMGWLTFDKEN